MPLSKPGLIWVTVIPQVSFGFQSVICSVTLNWSCLSSRMEPTPWGSALVKAHRVNPGNQSGQVELSASTLQISSGGAVIVVVSLI